MFVHLTQLHAAVTLTNILFPQFSVQLIELGFCVPEHLLFNPISAMVRPRRAGLHYAASRRDHGDCFLKQDRVGTVPQTYLYIPAKKNTYLQTHSFVYLAFTVPLIEWNIFLPDCGTKKEYTYIHRLLKRGLRCSSLCMGVSTF